LQAPAAFERAEINEAFTAIAIAVTRKLGLPEDIVNVARGHPIGATGAVLTTKPSDPSPEKGGLSCHSPALICQPASRPVTASRSLTSFMK
jgi:Thiolase, C-terminal domain